MVSEQEVKKQITAAFRRYRLIKELLPGIEEFIQDFRILHAQLRGRDRLEVRIETEHDGEDANWWRVPSLNAYFVPENGEERKVLSFGTWEGGRGGGERLLYND